MSFDYLTKDFIFDHTAFDKIKEVTPTYYIFPSVYIIYCKKSKKAYIGETTNIQNRLKQHLANPDKSQLKNIKIIFSPYFNKSSVLDIESNLIQNMLADGQFKLLNANDGISNHHYYPLPIEYRHYIGILLIFIVPTKYRHYYNTFSVFNNFRLPHRIHKVNKQEFNLFKGGLNGIVAIKINIEGSNQSTSSVD